MNSIFPLLQPCLPFVAAILKATVGLLVNKGRNVAAEKLKEGDVTNEQLRNLIVRELDDIKSKLDGIARKDLLASISFFQEGLVYLYKVKPNEEDGKKTQQGEDNAATPLRKDVGSSEASVKTVSLAEEMRSFQLTDRDSWSARALNDAKKRFEEARKEATRAFCNDALSTSDRILAMRYRIMATILEKVDCLTDSLAACRLCLRELHSLPAVKKSLDVHLQQGFKSMFNKAEREDTIRSVCRMNRVIFYISEIVEEDTDFFLWPCVDLGKYKVDPLRDARVTETIKKEDPEYYLLKAWPFFQEGEETMMFRNWFMTTNTKGQLIIVAQDYSIKLALLKVFDRNGNLLQSLHLQLPVIERPSPSFPLTVLVSVLYGFSTPLIIDIASDRANNVFLLVEGLDLNGLTVLVFDQHGNFPHKFDVNEGSRDSRIAVSDGNKVFVSAKVEEEREFVQVYSINGVLLNRIENESLGKVIGMTSVDSEGGEVMVFSEAWPPGLFAWRRVYHFSQLGNVLSRYYDVSDCVSHIRFLHKTEHVAMLQFGEDALFLCNKNGEFIRAINLKLSALVDSYDIIKEPLTVTAQGLVAMLATHKRTAKRMIVIL